MAELNRDDICMAEMSKILVANYSSDEFSLSGPKDSAICMEQSGSDWVVYQSEKSSKYDEARYNTILEACFDLISRLSNPDEAVITKNKLIDAIMMSKVA